MKNKIILTLLTITLLTNYSFSQDKKKIGLSGSIQNTQYGIAVPMWLGEKYVLAPEFGISYAQEIGSDISLGLAQRFYYKTEKLAPYFGLNLGTIIYHPSEENNLNDETKVDLIGGLAFGAEYFIADNFSVGLEAQGNLSKSAEGSTRFGNPDRINFNTGTMIYVTIYF